LSDMLLTIESWMRKNSDVAVGTARAADAHQIWNVEIAAAQLRRPEAGRLNSS